MPRDDDEVQRSELRTGSVENVRLTREGAYQIDLEPLMKGMPLVLKVDEGIYRIDLSPSPRIP